MTKYALLYFDHVSKKWKVYFADYRRIKDAVNAFASLQQDRFFEDYYKWRVKRVVYDYTAGEWMVDFGNTWVVNIELA